MKNNDDKKIKDYMKKLSDDFGGQIVVYTEHVDDVFKATKERLDSIDEKLEKRNKTL